MNRFIPPILGLVFLALTSGAYGYIYYRIDVAVEVIARARNEIAVIAARDTFAKAAASFVAETVAERSAVQIFLTPADGIASAIELVEDAARAAKVKATVGSVQIVALSDVYHERIDISVSAEGTFAGAARFATVLESLPRGAFLKEVRLEVRDKGWFGAYTVSFIKVKPR